MGDPNTGRIYPLGPDEQPEPGHVPLDAEQAERLGRLPTGERKEVLQKMASQLGTAAAPAFTPRALHDHEINDFNRSHMKVAALDGPGPGGASHVYALLALDGDGNAHGDIKIQFQNGPVKEAGVNGITDEALYAVLIDRLRAFQFGPYACRENALALTNLEQALMWLHKRTLDRERRGVEGTHAE